MIVIDTHVWVWWVDDNPRLRRAVRDMIDGESDVRVSAISLLEISTLVSLNRLALRPSARQWLNVAQGAEQIRVVPLTDEVCLESVTLPGEFHRDPADRLIVALGRLLDARVVTADGRMLSYPHVQTISAS